MRSLLKRYLREETRLTLRKCAKRLRYYGWRRYCPVCNSSVRVFLPAGVVERPDAICPVCDSAERHRLAWVFLKEHTNLFDGRLKRVLHVAPEYSIKQNLVHVENLDYVTSSFDGSGTRVRMDITAIPFPDDHFDCIYCSHVLEHVPDDRKAIKQLFRVLRPGGWALLQVPIEPNLMETFEDPSVKDPEERERVFGQDDHVRLYGADYSERLKESGFVVNIRRSSDIVGRENMCRMAIDPEEDIFFCRKWKIAPSLRVRQ